MPSVRTAIGGILALGACLTCSSAWAQSHPYYPNPEERWETYSLERAGISRDNFDEFLDYTFARKRFEHEAHITNALIVLSDGRIVHEEYRPEFLPPNDRQYIWSMGKLLANGILGRAERKGFIGRNAVVADWLPGFDHPNAKNLTLTHLMRMSSGISYYEEHPDGIVLSNSIYLNYAWRGTSNALTYMTLQGFKYPAGRQFNYSSGDCNLSMALLRKIFDSEAVNKGDRPQAAYNAFPWRELFSKIGMTSTTIEQDGSGNFAAASFSWSTARDMARLALLYLRNGEWDLNYDGEVSEQEKLFNSDWIEFSATIAPALEDENLRVNEDLLRLNVEPYGAYLWLNKPLASSAGQRPYPNLPDDALIAMGFRGQTLVILPSRKVVIVRLGSDGVKTKINRHMFYRLFVASLEDGPLQHRTDPDTGTGYDFGELEGLSIARIAGHFARSADQEVVFDDPFSIAPAKDLCSCLFVMRKDKSFCIEDNPQYKRLRGLGLVSAPVIDEEAKQVTAKGRLLPLLDHLPLLNFFLPSTHTATASYVSENLGCMISEFRAPWRGPLGPLNIFSDEVLTPSVDYFD